MLIILTSIYVYIFSLYVNVYAVYYKYTILLCVIQACSRAGLEFDSEAKSMLISDLAVSILYYILYTHVILYIHVMLCICTICIVYLSLILAQYCVHILMYTTEVYNIPIHNIIYLPILFMYIYFRSVPPQVSRQPLSSASQCQRDTRKSMPTLIRGMCVYVTICHYKLLYTTIQYLCNILFYYTCIYTLKILYLHSAILYYSIIHIYTLLFPYQPSTRHTHIRTSTTSLF